MYSSNYFTWSKANRQFSSTLHPHLLGFDKVLTRRNPSKHALESLAEGRDTLLHARACAHSTRNLNLRSACFAKTSEHAM